MFGECHAHFILDGVNYRTATARHRDKVNDELIRKLFSQYAEYGIGFIRDGGDNAGVSQRAKQIAHEYGIDYRTPICALHKKGNYGGIVGEDFEDIQEFYVKLKALKSLGLDFVKIMASGIMDFNEFGRITPGTLNKNELTEIMRIAHGEGFSVMVHVNGAETIKNVIEAGADSIEHGYYMDDETISCLRESEAVWVPTLAPVANLLRNRENRFPSEVVSAILQLHKKNILKAVDSGAAVALGSDAGAYLVAHCDGLMDELTYFKEIIPDSNYLNNVLTQGENKIKNKFRRNHGQNVFWSR